MRACRVVAGRVRERRVACLIVAALLAAAVPLPAQLVRGTVTVAATGAPLGGALVSLADSAGVVAARTVASPAGTWALFAPRAGTWQLRFAAIGFAPAIREGVRVGDAATVVDVALAERPFELEEVEVVAAGARCEVSPEGAAIVERLMTEAATALGLVEATIASRRLEFVTEQWRIRIGSVPGDTVRRTQVTRGRASWPLVSADAALLREGGFVHDPGGLAPAIGYTEDSGPIYYGPDLQVLVAPWFVGSHCFDLVAAAGDSLVVRFAPRGRPNHVDLAGILVLDRETLALRRLGFSYVGLPRWVPAEGAGGEVTFERTRDGLWVTRSWRLRAPIEQRRQVIGAPRGPTFGGWVETGGRVVEVVGG